MTYHHFHPRQGAWTQQPSLRTQYGRDGGRRDNHPSRKASPEGNELLLRNQEMETPGVGGENRATTARQNSQPPYQPESMMRQDRASTQTTGLTHNSSRSRRNRRVEGPHRHPRARRSWRHEYHLEQGRQRKQCLVVLGGLRWSLTALGVLVCLAWMRAEGRDNRLGSPRLGRHGLRGASLEQRWPTALEGGPCTCEWVWPWRYPMWARSPTWPRLEVVGRGATLGSGGSSRASPRHGHGHALASCTENQWVR